jgi:hypothetical protein
MMSIATKVEQIVTESPFLTEGMALGLINLSELARQLKPQLESDLWKPVGQAAVVMALRRVGERLPPPGRASEIAIAPQCGELTTRSELVISTFRMSDNSNECQRRLLALAEPFAGMFVTVTRGVHEVLVVCSAPLLPQLDEAFAGERVLTRIDKLTALTLRLNPDSHHTPGVYNAVLKKLAWNKVSVVNMMCTFTELTIFLEQSQTAPAFSVLSKIVSH